MIEVEIRAKVDDFDDIKQKLETIGAKSIGVKKQVDRVFGSSVFLDEDNLIIEGGLSARIRQVNGKISLDFKEIIRDGGGFEVRAGLDEVETGVKLLEKLGFIEAFTISKVREEYIYKGLGICLDEVERLGKFIEIEKMISTLDDQNLAKQECLNLLEEIFPENIIENRKYGDLMQELNKVPWKK